MDPSPPDAPPSTLALLETAPLSVRGYLANASNHTLLVDVGEDLLGVYKPQAGERPLWDFPPGTLCRREVAAFVVSDFLGWDVVPPTVLRDGPAGCGSVQLFVVHDPRLHYFVLVDDAAFHEPLARIATFDLVVNNADRKASHILLGDDGVLYAIDHGLTFHAQTKLRTVVWELGGHVLPAAWQADLARLAHALEDDDADVTRTLRTLLGGHEVGVLAARARAVARLRALPDVPEQRRPYPWPLL
jgi:uncharacterized repeat protein (TIGR03843 family)